MTPFIKYLQSIQVFLQGVFYREYSTGKSLVLNRKLKTNKDFFP